MQEKTKKEKTVSKITTPHGRIKVVKPVLKEVTKDKFGFNYCVSKEEQLHEIKSMKATIPYGHFFFSVNFLEKKIENIHGVRHHLGYDDKFFDFQQYLSLIHPSQFETINLLAFRIIEIVNQPDYPLSFGGNKYSFRAAFKHNEGYWVFCKCSLSCWQYAQLEDKNFITDYLTDFYVIETHIDENIISGMGISPSAIDTNGRKLDFWLEQMRTVATAEIQEKLIEVNGNIVRLFTPKELKIIKKIADNPKLTAPEICKDSEIGMSERTLDTHRTNILRKGSDFFNERFATLKDLDERMRRDYLVLIFIF